MFTVSIIEYSVNKLESQWGWLSHGRAPLSPARSDHQIQVLHQQGTVCHTKAQALNVQRWMFNPRRLLLFFCFRPGQTPNVSWSLPLHFPFTTLERGMAAWTRINGQPLSGVAGQRYCHNTSHWRQHIEQSDCMTISFIWFCSDSALQHDYIFTVIFFVHAMTN